MIPFFVADRPASLEILKSFFAENLDHQFGILTHAFTTSSFQEKFKDFPYFTALKYSNIDKPEEQINTILSKTVIKFADSGIFQLERNISYEKLFEIYENLNVHYGVIVDFFKESEKTIESAKEAIKIYKKKKHSFKLVGVAQGKTIEEYLKCYEAMKKYGYRYIAIGGLLKRNKNSNYVRLSCEEFLTNLIEKIKDEFFPDWLFTFGIYNPKRHSLLESLGVWGADYKGWLFEYEEDYSFVLNYIEGVPFKKHLERLIQKYSDERKNGRKNLVVLRQMIEKKLNVYGKTLQEFRFLRVRENLKKKIIEPYLNGQKN